MPWSVRAIFFPIVTGPCCEGQAGFGPCFGGEAERGEDILTGNGLVVLKPSPGGRNSAGLFLANRFVLNGSVGETAGERIKHGCEHADDGGELRRRRSISS